MYEGGGAAAVSGFPGGSAWAAAIEAIPERERHLATHEGHLMRLTERDRAALVEGADLLPAFTLTGTPDELRARVEALTDSGVTEVVYQPTGDDIAGELERFHAAVS